MSGSPLRSILAEFGFNVDSKALEHGHKNVEGFIGTLKHLGGIVAEAFIFHEVKEFVEHIVETGVALEHLSVKTGATIEELQGLEYAAKLSGVGVETLDHALGKLGRALVGAKNGGGELGAAFKQAGIATKDAHGNVRSAAEALPDIADAFVKIENPSERAALAMKFFGRGGVALVPLLAKGAAGIRELTHEAEELGGGFSEAGVEGAVKMHEATARLDFALTGLKSNIAATVLPLLADLVTGAAHLVKDFREWTKNTKIAEAAMIGFGAKGVLALVHHLGGLAGIFRTLTGILFRTIAPILILEDFFVFMAGGKSLIGDAIEKLFGKGTSEKVRKAVQEVIDKVKDLARAAGPLKTAAGALAIILGVKLVSGAAAAAAAMPALIAQFAALAPPLVAAAGAAAALMLLMQQISKLGDVTEGLGLTGTIGEMVMQGTWDPAKAVDNYQNRQARKRRVASDGEDWKNKDVNGNPIYNDGKPIRAGKTVDAKGRAIAHAPVPHAPGVNVEQTNHVENHITVTPGTEPQTARRIGEAAASGTRKGIDLAVTHAALVPASG